jgi:phosphatidylserine decarboxylase
MKLHKEGAGIIRNTAIVWTVLTVAAFLITPAAGWGTLGVGVVAVLLTIRFFRVPERPLLHDEGAVYAPADGEIVIIRETHVDEYLGERRIQVSTFMSLWNVHVNWFPVGGRVVYTRYHPGKYLVAWHPKASELNERMTVVVETVGGRKVLFRQIAGFVARRIVTYARQGGAAEQNSQCGVIKFGSRVDLFLPMDAEICVKNGQKVVGTQTVIARLK